MTPNIQDLATKIQLIHQQHESNSGPLIERYLNESFSLYSKEQKLKYIASIKKLCAGKKETVLNNGTQGDREPLLHICKLLLGKNFHSEDLESDEIVERLTHALNTVFNTLNQLILLINTTLLSEDQKKETIRHIIGYQLDDSSNSQTLEEYLNQIKVAFLTSHQAFQNAAFKLTARILHELDPAHTSIKKSKSFKIGPLLKAEKYEHYEKTFANCKKWFDSGRFMDDFLREFEKHCQKLSFQQRR